MKKFNRFANFKQNKLYRLFNRGSERIDKELDIVKIIKNIRKQRIIWKRHQQKSEANLDKYFIRHSKKNLIDLDQAKREFYEFFSDIILHGKMERMDDLRSWIFVWVPKMLEELETYRKAYLLDKHKKRR